MALFESYERREKQILDVLAQYDIKSIEECREICQAKGFDPYKIVEGIQPICFENAKWAYTVGCAIALKKGVKSAAEAAAAIGEGLQSFCIPGSVADQRKVGLGHGNLGKMLLEEVLFLTVLVRTQLRLSQESTASHILKPKWIIIPARLRKYSARLILTDFVQRLTATALTT